MEKKIFIRFLFAALLITAGCRKDDTPAEEKTPVGFRAMSQTAVVKADANDNNDPLSNYHQDFGVWGIATEAINHPYVLWKDSTFEKVEQVGNSINYAPVTDAYWLTGYSYNFLALAPYENGVNNLTINKNLATDNQSANPSISFTYDMSGKYNPTVQGQTPNYTYDLLGAAASHKVKRNEIPVSQDLVFWHLFSQIEIEYIRFDTGIDGEVTKILLKAYPSGTYTIDYDNSDTNPTKPTGITPDVVKTNANNTLANKSSIVFEDPDFSDSHPIVNIIPQDVADLELYIDFTINEGTEDNPIPVTYKDFKINLNAQKLTKYDYNGKYIWKITIGNRNSIKFDVSVTDWDQVTDLPEIDM